MDTLLAPFAVPRVAPRLRARHCHREVAPHLRRAPHEHALHALHGRGVRGGGGGGLGGGFGVAPPFLFADLASRAAAFALAAASRAARPCVSTARAQVPTNRSSASTSARRCSSAVSGASAASAGKNASTMVGTPPLTPAASEPCNDRRSAPSALSARARGGAVVRRALLGGAEPPTTAELPWCALRESVSQASADAAIARLCASSISAVDTAGASRSPSRP